MKKLSLLLFLAFAPTAFSNGLIRYVDSAVATSGNGLTWGTAWKNLDNISGVGAGDTVYVSGGTTTKTYLIGGSFGEFNAPSGTSGNPFTLAIGRDAGHTGMAIFQSNAGGGVNFLANSPQWVTLDGWFNGTRHFQTKGYQFAVYQQQNSGQVTRRGLVFRGFEQTDNGTFMMYGCDQSEVGWVNWPLIDDRNYRPKIMGIGGTQPAVGFSRNSIHDCNFNIYYDPAGTGNDGIKEPGNCDIYNNQFVGTVLAGSNGDHQDAIQVSGSGYYLRIWNNYFQDFSNYCIFLDGVGDHVWIWNNVFNYTDTNLHNNQGIAPSGSPFTDHQYFNNTFINMSDSRNSQAMALGDSAGGNVWNNCHMQNNLLYNSGLVLRPGGSPVIDHNTPTNSTSGLAFASIAAKDFHLTSAATAAIGQGVNPAPAYMTAVLTTDKDGVTRSNPWDLGAFKFGAAAPDTTPPTATSATINPAGNQITIGFSEGVNFGAGGGGGFTLNMSGGTSVMSSPAGMGSNSITFNLSRVINAGEAGTLSYSQPGNGWQDLAAAPNALASFPPPTVNVTNSSTQGPPGLTSATINSAGNQIALVFSQVVQAGTGGNGGWTLNVSPAAALGTMTGTGSNTLTYNINRVINVGESVTLTYTQPGNGIEAVASGADVASITTPRAVANNSTQGATSTPVITLAAGPYFGTQTTTITDADSGAGAVIHYTVDGTTPTGSSATYSAPITISTNQTIQAIATWTGHLNSATASSTYEVVSWNSLGTAWKTFSVGQKTGTFTWNFSVTAPAAGSDGVVGLGPSAVSAYTGMACIVQFNNNTINAINGGGYTTGPAYTPSAVYNFVATINVTAHTWTCTVTPAAGGATTTIVTNAAFRTEQAAAAQLSWVGIQANSGTITLSNMAFPSGASSARYIGLRGVPAAGGAVP